MPTNNPLHAVLKTAQDLQVQELVMGASNKYTADEQLEQIGFYWINLHGGETPPLTVRILGRDRDVYLDLGGGNRIPKHGERRARSVAELRSMGVGVDHVLLVHDGTRTSRDLFQSLLTMLDPQVVLTVAALQPTDKESDGASDRGGTRADRAVETRGRCAFGERDAGSADHPHGPRGPLRCDCVFAPAGYAARRGHAARHLGRLRRPACPLPGTGGDAGGAAGGIGGIVAFRLAASISERGVYVWRNASSSRRNSLCDFEEMTMPVRRWLRPWFMAALLGLVMLVGARAANEEAVEARMRRDITFLASDECEGRGVDTKGIDKAAVYIADAYKQAGLKPGGPDGSYFQPFKIAGAAKLEGPATIQLRGPQGQEIELKAGADFQVMGFSGSGKLTAPLVFAGFGVTAEKEGYDDYKGVDVAKKIVVLIRKSPRYDSPTAALGGDNKNEYAAFVTKISNAEFHKAAAVLIVNDAADGAKGDKLMNFAELSQGIGAAAVPAFQVRRGVVDALLRSSLQVGLREMQQDIDHDLKPRSAALTGWTASVESHVGRKVLTAKNVIGVLEGSGPLAKETVVIGAHYDHLGYGGPGSGSLNPKVRDIHHGADDNASGTTLVAGAGRRFGKMADQKGPQASSFSWRSAPRNAACSVPRITATRRRCSPWRTRRPWSTWTWSAGCRRTRKPTRTSCSSRGRRQEWPRNSRGWWKPSTRNTSSLSKFSKSFMPNSDHASFYRKKVPVVFFWTGMHPDYHKPSEHVG